MVANKKIIILVISTFIAGLCSIIYELLISTASSYFLGDSIKQFSLTIGIYMAAMGIGSYASRLIKKNLLSKFIFLEIILGLLGGLSIPILYCSFAYTEKFYTTIMILLITSIGILIGLEIPFLTRIMEKYYSLKFNISNILSLDYLGALIATLLFPFILLPCLGILRSSLFFGIINMAIGFMNLWCFADKISVGRQKLYKTLSIFFTLILVLFFILGNSFIDKWSNNLYEDPILISKQTPYQKIILTKNKNDIRLFIDGNLQFSSLDEHRYHESLIHIPCSLNINKENVLVLGGGDGLPIRELLKYKDIKSIDVVDLDPEIIKLATSNRYMKKINQSSLENKRVKIINKDAFLFLQNTDKLYDIIIADLPDPNNISLSRLYSKEFYNLVYKKLSRTGIFVTQATSPFFAKKAFWCIVNTIKQADFSYVIPYHVYIPSFGDWGFVMASRIKLKKDNIDIKITGRYIENKILNNLFIFEKDIIDNISEYNTLDDPVVLKYYLQGWRSWD